MMRSLSTSAFGQPSETKPTFGALAAVRAFALGVLSIVDVIAVLAQDGGAFLARSGTSVPAFALGLSHNDPLVN
jgi:hypothetical protein